MRAFRSALRAAIGCVGQHTRSATAFKATNISFHGSSARGSAAFCLSRKTRKQGKKNQPEGSHGTAAQSSRGFPLLCILQRWSRSLACAKAPGAPGVPRGMRPQHPPCLWVSSCQSPSEHSHRVCRAPHAPQPQRVRDKQEEGSRTDTLTQHTGSLQVSEWHPHFS